MKISVVGTLVGSLVGRIVSESVGLTDRASVGESVEIGVFKGGFVRSSVGILVRVSATRDLVGNSVMKTSVVGTIVGSLVGRMVSKSGGLTNGASLGESVKIGACEGGFVGSSVGISVGVSVRDLVGNSAIMGPSVAGTLVGSLLGGMVGELVALLVGASMGESVKIGAFEGGLAGGLVGTPVGLGTLFGALGRRLFGALGDLETLGGRRTSLVGVIEGGAIGPSVDESWMGESGRGPLLGLRLRRFGRLDGRLARLGVIAPGASKNCKMRLVSSPCLSNMSPPRFFLVLFVFLNILSVATLLCAKQVIRGKIISHSKPVNDTACATTL